MEIRKIFERAAEPAGAHYDPEQMKIVGDAFERAWKRIEGDVSGNAQGTEDARAKLAKVVLSLAKQRVDTTDALAEKALATMFCDPIQL